MKDTFVHPTAIVHENTIMGEGCHVGPYCVIGSGVKLGTNVSLMSNVHIGGNTQIGDNSKIFPFAVIGVAPQDLKYKGEETEVFIGSNTTIREHVTVHLGTHGGRGKTTIGDSCLLMVGVHVAHDVFIGNNVIISNAVLLGGHVFLYDHCVIGGGSAIHQFCRIGEYAFVGGLSGIVNDLVPYVIYIGVRNPNIDGLNSLGLKRAGFSSKKIREIDNLYNYLFSNEGNFHERLAQLKIRYPDSDTTKTIVDFIESATHKNIYSSYKSTQYSLKHEL